MENKNRKVIVAMSGGIDSSVTAALLKRAGFNVVGVFMKLTNLPQLRESEKRARKVAKILKIPFLVLDLRKQFKKKIINYFLEENKRGNTPNPCVVCNKEIKFGLLLERALELDADFVATGHYARNLKSQISNLKSTSQNSKLNYRLLKGKDKSKDQSYFLWQLSQEQLKHILFPIGNYTRKEVENLARKFKLPVLRAEKSVEICFIKTAIEDFLKRYLKEKPGSIVDTKGNVLGKHYGLWFYTIGQRKGICLPHGPYYVLAKDSKKNILIVAKNEKDLEKKELICENVNWISPKQSLWDATGQTGETPRLRPAFVKATAGKQGDGGQVKLPLKVMAKIRYRHKPASATIYPSSKSASCQPAPLETAGFPSGLSGVSCKLIFDTPQRAITPGQSVVFYRKNKVLGGGIIY